MKKNNDEKYKLAFLEGRYIQLKEDFELLISNIHTNQVDSSKNEVKDPMQEKKELTQVLDERWKNWIKENLSNGISPKQLSETLIQNNFSYDIIAKELDIRKEPNPKTIIDHLIKNKVSKIDVELPLFVIEDFLSKNEAESIIKTIQENVKPSTIAGSNNKAKLDKEIRKSNTCNLENNNDSIVKEIQNKICNFINVPIEFTEPIQGQHYESGGFYHKHWDSVCQNENSYANFIRSQGNRTWTALINLNEPEEGGETGFFEYDLEFKPKVGQLILWYNLDLDTRLLNRASAHGGKPIIKGEKFILTQWFREFNRTINP